MQDRERRRRAAGHARHAQRDSRRARALASLFASLPAWPLAAQAGNDGFGIRMIYPTRPGGEVWFMDMDAPQSDPRFDPQGDLERNPDGSWRFEDDGDNDQVRMNVATSAGYDPSRIEDDHFVLAARGYMQDPRDWKNIEMTGYVRVESVDADDDEITWYARGGKHNDSRPCEGVGYKGDLKFDGSVRFAKEQWHVNYHFWPDDPAPFTSSIIGRWVGFKMIMANVDDDRHVRLELWVDDDANNQWTRALPATGEPPFVDAGGWGDSAQVCSDTPVPEDLPITWGGPLAVFRWDNVERISFKYLSVREIALVPAGRVFANGFE